MKVEEIIIEREREHLLLLDYEKVFNSMLRHNTHTHTHTHKHTT